MTKALKALEGGNTLLRYDTFTGLMVVVDAQGHKLCNVSFNNYLEMLQSLQEAKTDYRNVYYRMPAMSR